MNNTIDDSVKIIGDVKLGKNNVLLPYTILIGPLEIGDNNIIGPHVVIGSPGQDTRNPRYDSSKSRIKIGSNNIIREFSAIQKPCYEDLTSIGNDVYIMQSVHIPHDAKIGDKTVFTPMVVLAGITKVLEGANLGMGCSINQRCVIGQYSIVAQGAAVVKNVKPFSRYIPGKPISVNSYAVKKYGLESYESEITQFVLENKMPTSDPIKKIVDEFYQLHSESKKDLY